MQIESKFSVGDVVYAVGKKGAEIFVQQVQIVGVQVNILPKFKENEAVSRILYVFRTEPTNIDEEPNTSPEGGLFATPEEAAIEAAKAFEELKSGLESNLAIVKSDLENFEKALVEAKVSEEVKMIPEPKVEEAPALDGTPAAEPEKTE